ncbi:MAG: bifunctional glycosyltransferase family 2/GtrA family protein [Gammaproteobacteria bacterium]|nr:bifunctional glycosyltransferase family 2/GtrA family protein [Gammaproteobacteria bacterium]
MISKKLSVIVPCFNEERTLENCVNRVIDSLKDFIELEIVIIDDCSVDSSNMIAKKLASQYPQVNLYTHDENQGKGASLRTGFAVVSGDFIVIQDADLEYNPVDLKKLIMPLNDGYADVVLGSRFSAAQERRVLYYWHGIGNKILTMLSNMLTNLSVTDMETCYKLFKQDVVKDIAIEENRFGFEPEIIAKIAEKKCLVYEIGISYHGRTYEEGKKIGWKDGFRALYCILHYNAFRAPIFIQFLIYALIGGLSAIFGFIFHSIFQYTPLSIQYSKVLAFLFAAAINYVLCINFLFKHKARYTVNLEPVICFIVVSCVAFIGFGLSELLAHLSPPVVASSIMGVCSLILNFLGKKFIVFNPRKEVLINGPEVL